MDTNGTTMGTGLSNRMTGREERFERDSILERADHPADTDTDTEENES